MRLTLRTLLSWKDGMLDDEAARDLAARIDASDAARGLVERIAEVVARPTLSASAPDAAGFAAAANTTAEYLDNVLPAERLGEFERVCFASDAQLAETAATHEILAAWSREPAAALDGATRRRLLAALRAHTEGRHARDEGAGMHAAPAAGAASVPRPKPRAVRAPATAWLLVAAALALFAVLIGVLGWSLTRRGAKPAGDRDVAVRHDEVHEPAAAEPVAAATADVNMPQDVTTTVEPPVATPSVPPGAEPEAAANASVAAPAPAEPDRGTADTGGFPPFGGEEPDERPMEPIAGAADVAGDPTAPTPPVAATDPAAQAVPPPGAQPADQPGGPAAGTGERRVPQGDALAIAAPAAVAAAGQPPAVAAPAAPAAPAVPPRDARIAVVGPVVLLHRPAGGAADAWQTGVDGVPLELPVDLVAPSFGRPTLVVDDTRIALEPGTRGALSRDADGTPRLEVVFGAAVAAGGDRLGVTAGGLAGTITAGLAAPVGVESKITRPPGGDAESSERVARVMPTAGRLEWLPAAGAAPADAATAVPAGQALVWRSGRPEAATREVAGPPPDWLAGRRVDDPVDALAARALAERLSAGTAAIPALRELAVDRRSERRMAAAAALAILGEFDAVARLMCADGAIALRENEWSRLDVTAVQPALARGPKAAEALAAAFAAAAPPGAADAVVRFARGCGDEELTAGAAAELVAALESPHLVVRRYAIANLVDIARPSAVERMKYRADRPAEALREGAAWWRAQLDRDRIRRGP